MDGLRVRIGVVDNVSTDRSVQDMSAQVRGEFGRDARTRIERCS
jgi:hypothetical protein